MTTDTLRQITGILRTPEGSPFPNKTLTWFRERRVVQAQGSSVVLDEPFYVVTDAAGAIDHLVMAGNYLVLVRLKDTDRYFRVSVPDQAGPLNIADLVDQPAVEQSIITQVQELILKARAWAETPEDTEVAVGQYSALHHSAKAAAQAAASAASATQAALYDGPWLDTVTALLADTTLTYTAGTGGSVTAGDIVRTRAEGFGYEVADSAAVDHHVTTAGGVKLYVLPSNGEFSAASFGNDVAKIGGSGDKFVDLRQTRDAVGNFLTITEPGTALRNSEIDMNFTGLGGSGHAVVVLSNDVTLRDLTITDLGNDVSAAGTGVIAFTSDTSTLYRVRALDYSVTGDIGSVDTNGALLEDVFYGRLRGGYAENIVSYAHELKHNARWNILSDLITVNSGFALGYGQSEVGIDGADFNVAYGWVGERVDVGLIVGEGAYNLFGLQLTDGTASPLTVAGGERYGVHWSTDTIGNVHLGALTYGPLDFSVRDRGNRNYTAIASHDTSPNIVTFQAESSQNHVEVLHPGGRTSILNAINNGGTTTGVNANTVSCAHTGERVGSRSGRFTDRLAATGAAPISSQGWVYEGGANSIHALCVDTTDTGAAGVQINRGAVANVAGFYYVLSSAYWLLRTAGANIARFSATLIRPETDNTMDLGSASFRFNELFATTLRPGAGGVQWTSGSGTPEGVVTAVVGSIYTRTDGGAGTTLYVKESGAGNTGWVAK